MKELTITAALKDFFGFHPNQTLQQFMEEVRALSDQDKADFKTMLEATGNYKIKVVYEATKIFSGYTRS